MWFHGYMSQFTNSVWNIIRVDSAYCPTEMRMVFIIMPVRSIKQEIWANAHETRDSISFILYAGCLGLSLVISAKIYSKCAPQPEIAKHSLKPILVWGSRSFKVIDVDTPEKLGVGVGVGTAGKLFSSACYDK